MQVAAVRVQAVGALRPFQFELEAGDDEEALAEDKVRSELMRVMVSDSSPDVRQAALAAVTKTIGMFDKARAVVVCMLVRRCQAKKGKRVRCAGTLAVRESWGVDNSGWGLCRAPGSPCDLTWKEENRKLVCKINAAPRLERAEKKILAKHKNKPA